MKIFGMEVETDESLPEHIVKFRQPDGSEKTVNMLTGNEVIEAEDLS